MITNMTDHYKCTDIHIHKNPDIQQNFEEYELFSKLDDKTCTMPLTFPDGSILHCLIDSGATRSVVSQSALLMSPYLKNQPRKTVIPNHFIVGSNAKMCSDQTLQAECDINNTKISVNFHILPTCGAFPIILGLKSLQDLGAVIDFSKNALYIKKTKLPVKPLHDYIIQPGQTQIVKITAKMPHRFNNMDLLINFTGKTAHLVQKYIVVRFHKNIADIIISNPGTESLKLSSNYHLGFIDTRDLSVSFIEIPGYHMNNTYSCPQATPANLSTMTATDTDQTSPHTLFETGHRPKAHSNKINKHSKPDILKGTRPEILNDIQQWADHKKVSKASITPNKNLSKQELKWRNLRLKEFPFLDINNHNITKSDEYLLNTEIDLKNSKFSEKSKAKWREMALKHRQAFSLFGEVGEDTTSNVTLKLKKEFREDEQGLNLRPFRYSEEDKQVIQKELDKMESQGI